MFARLEEQFMLKKDRDYRTHQDLIRKIFALCVDEHDAKGEDEQATAPILTAREFQSVPEHLRKLIWAIVITSQKANIIDALRGTRHFSFAMGFYAPEDRRDNYDSLLSQYAPDDSGGHSLDAEKESEVRITVEMRERYTPSKGLSRIEALLGIQAPEVIRNNLDTLNQIQQTAPKTGFNGFTPLDYFKALPRRDRLYPIESVELMPHECNQNLLIWAVARADHKAIVQIRTQHERLRYSRVKVNSNQLLLNLLGYEGTLLMYAVEKANQDDSYIPIVKALLGFNDIRPCYYLIGANLSQSQIPSYREGESMEERRERKKIRTRDRTCSMTRELARTQPSKTALQLSTNHTVKQYIHRRHAELHTFFTVTNPQSFHRYGAGIVGAGIGTYFLVQLLNLGVNTAGSLMIASFLGITTGVITLVSMMPALSLAIWYLNEFSLRYCCNAHENSIAAEESPLIPS